MPQRRTFGVEEVERGQRYTRLNPLPEAHRVLRRRAYPNVLGISRREIDENIGPPYSTRETEPENETLGKGACYGKVGWSPAKHDARPFRSAKVRSRQLAGVALKADEAATLYPAPQHIHRGQSDEASYETIGGKLEDFARRSPPAVYGRGPLR